MLLSSTAQSSKTTEAIMNRLELGKIYANNTIWFLVLKVRENGYDVLILSSQLSKPGKIIQNAFQHIGMDKVKLIC
jgi:hypothetical protein